MKEIDDYLKYMTVVDLKEIREDMLEVTIFQLVYDKKFILINGEEKATLCLGKGIDKKDIYVCVEGLRFYVKKEDLKDVIDVDANVKNPMQALTQDQSNVLRNNKDKLIVYNVSESKMQKLGEYEFKEDWVPLDETLSKNR